MYASGIFVLKLWLSEQWDGERSDSHLQHRLTSSTFYLIK